MIPSCPHASNGCNYPESECSGACTYRHPRTTAEAFKGPEYGAAIQRYAHPRRRMALYLVAVAMAALAYRFFA